MANQSYLVPVEFEAVGASADEAEKLVMRFLNEALRKLGDERGKLRRCRLHPTSDTIAADR